MLQLTGKIIKFLPKTEGYSQRGHWVKAGFVIEYGDEYPAKAAFSIFGETRLQQCAGMKEGDEVVVEFNPQSREYQERWYTDLQCIRIVLTQNVQQQAQQQMTSQQATSTQPPISATMPQQTSSALPQPDDGLQF